MALRCVANTAVTGQDCPLVPASYQSAFVDSHALEKNSELPLLCPKLVGLCPKPPARSARKIEVTGGLITHGQGIDPLELHGRIDSLQVTGGVLAVSGGFDRL